jgi:hypothetical protein
MHPKSDDRRLDIRLSEEARLKMKIRGDFGCVLFGPVLLTSPAYARHSAIKRISPADPTMRRTRFSRIQPLSRTGIYP